MRNMRPFHFVQSVIYIFVKNVKQLIQICAKIIRFCNVENHKNKLEYFCHTHNKLCCSSCVTNIKAIGNGQHGSCKVTILQDVKKQYKDKLQENINYLENISKTIEESINNLKKISEEININKENLKKKVQTIFTKIKNALNYREDAILLEIDKYFEQLFFKEDLIKESEKLPKKIKSSLNNGKNMNNEWDNDKRLSYLINECINIEDNINNIKKINKKINKKIVIDKEINVVTNIITNEKKMIESIKEFGKFGNVINNNNNVDEDEDEEDLGLGDIFG